MKRSSTLALLLTCTVCVFPLSLRAETPVHPIHGKWTYLPPNSLCADTYVFRPDGIRTGTSGEETSENRYVISAQPTAKGFYKWTDTVIKNNGKKDCTGSVVKVGDNVTLYVRFQPNQKSFMMCLKESLDRCVGPFLRAKEQGKGK